MQNHEVSIRQAAAKNDVGSGQTRFNTAPSEEEVLGRVVIGQPRWVAALSERLLGRGLGSAWGPMTASCV